MHFIVPQKQKPRPAADLPQTPLRNLSRSPRPSSRLEWSTPDPTSLAPRTSSSLNIFHKSVPVDWKVLKVIDEILTLVEEYHRRSKAVCKSVWQTTCTLYSNGESNEQSP